MTKNISAIICTFGRKEMCRQTVQYLLPQLDSTSELIIVDQATAEHRSEYCDPSVSADQVVFLRLAVPSMVQARNTGIHRARGRVVLFLDDDIRPSAHLLSAHLNAYANPSVGGVAGRILDEGRVPSEQLDARALDPLFGWLFTNFDHHERVELQTARGCNMSFRRELLVELGGFDRRYRWFRDDSDVSFRVRAAGYKLVFEPDAELTHLDAGHGGTRENGKPTGPVRSEVRSYLRHFRHYRDNLYFIHRHLKGPAKRFALRHSYRSYVGLSRWPWRLLAKNACFVAAYYLAAREAARWKQGVLDHSPCLPEPPDLPFDRPDHRLG